MTHLSNVSPLSASNPDSNTNAFPLYPAATVYVSAVAAGSVTATSEYECVRMAGNLAFSQTLGTLNTVSAAATNFRTFYFA